MVLCSLSGGIVDVLSVCYCVERTELGVWMLSLFQGVVKFDAV